LLNEKGGLIKDEAAFSSSAGRMGPGYAFVMGEARGVLLFVSGKMAEQVIIRHTKITAGEIANA